MTDGLERRARQARPLPTATVTDLAYQRVIRPAVFRIGDGDAERAHETTLRMLATVGKLPPALAAMSALLARHRRPLTVAGIDFDGVVGLAAGMDKFGIAARSWGPLGFGFAELGTVTAQAQPGNPKPRLFRLPASAAVINRMGFNNGGAEALADTLARFGVRRGNRAVGIPLGISIGKTKITPLHKAVADYLTSFRVLAPYADYIAVNVSSPNTPGLRSLQDRGALTELLSTLSDEAAIAGRPVPILVKIAPDLTEPALDEVLEVADDVGIQGLIATNTTLSREGLDHHDLDLAPEVGGLSGAPLARRARQVVGYLAERTELPIIGVGGIDSVDDAQALLDAGAQLLQILTGFIYRGPGLIDRINHQVRFNQEVSR
ncbi:quinone-dependent dihydroorotate dehydrogenase [Microlunatus soli]|uniref:Dihydroorotate dehydrogenase (quinone) n=1 Tax=Microlunatus soli TaxID=630515 RepID=A0A1H2AJK4_9ACTN|nr:quinone-dependent dihydroorotate dehydrogenase [Microlunatus soli]SDT46143.1 dihydroorotate oxidase A [Microlunatus soli]